MPRSPLAHDLLSGPPPEVLAEVDAAWERAQDLFADELELRFDIDGLTHQRAGLRIFPAAFVEVAGHAAAQILGLAHVNDFTLGVLVEIHAGLRGQNADFLVEVHKRAGNAADVQASS